MFLDEYYKDKKLQLHQLVQQTRTGVRNVLVPQTVRNSIGDRIINVAFVPFVYLEQLHSSIRFKPKEYKSLSIL